MQEESDDESESSSSSESETETETESTESTDEDSSDDDPYGSFKVEMHDEPVLVHAHSVISKGLLCALAIEAGFDLPTKYEYVWQFSSF